MTLAFEEIVNLGLIEKLYLANNTQELDEIKKRITKSLIWKDDSLTKYTDHELFLREDPNSCHYFPYKYDLTSNHLMCRQQYHEMLLQIQELAEFKSHTDFLQCLKDNFRDYALTRLYQLFQEYYSIVTFDDSKYAKNFLNELLSKHDILNADMEKINIMLGEEHQSSYKFYTLYPTSNLMKNTRIVCFHIKTFIDFPKKMFMCKDENYLKFEEQILPTVYYRTRNSMIVKCSKCGEQYHQEKNEQSNVGTYYDQFYFSKTNDIKQEFGIEKDKYEKYEASVDLTADE